MRAKTSLTVKHAELVGSSGIMEDRIFIGKKSVIVLDGATQADQTIEQTGGWIADQIGQRFSNLIEGEGDKVELTELLAQAIADTRDEFNLVPGRSPSTTVCAARFLPQQVDLLVLGDSPAASRNSNDSHLAVLEDRRLDLTTKYLAKPAVQQSNGTEWREYYRTLCTLRNRPGGFWIAEADPTAAKHARTGTVSSSAVVLLCTDGVASIVGSYKAMSWQELFDAARCPDDLVTEVKRIEMKDSLRVDYPRSKISDDKSIVLASR